MKSALWCCLALSIFLGGCSIPIQSLKTLTIPPSGAQIQATDKSFLIYPFEDQRGEEAGLFPFIDFVPLVDLFYSHVYARFPENSGLLVGKREGRTVTAQGTLDQAMPYMLGNLMRQMGFANRWAPLDSVDAQMDLKSFDYVVRGRLKSTRLHIAGNVLPLGLLGILGVPCVFIDFRIEYEVILFKNQPEGGEIYRQTYTWSGKKAAGFYYHWHASYELLVEALNKTLPQVVTDLARVLPR